MRTTLSIDDDLLGEAKALASRHHTSVSKVISSLARKGLNSVEPSETRNGVPLLPLQVDAAPVTPEFVAQLNEPAGARTKRTGLMTGQISVPEDFDLMGTVDVEQLFDRSP
jgi:hypothetical protein